LSFEVTAHKESTSIGMLNKYWEGSK